MGNGTRLSDTRRARDGKSTNICRCSCYDWKFGLRIQTERSQKGNVKAGLERSSVCCCLRRFHIQREEDHRLSTGVYLLLWEPPSKRAVILGIINQCPAFSVTIKNSTEVWFPCPSAAAGCWPQPQACLSSSCGSLLHSLPRSWWHRAIYSGITLAVMYRDLSLARQYPSMCLGYFPDTFGVSSSFYSTRDGVWHLILNFPASEWNVVVLHPLHHLVTFTNSKHPETLCSVTAQHHQ